MHQESAEEAANARYVTVFLSLNEVSKELGPMELYPGTHRMYIPWPEDVGGARGEEGGAPEGELESKAGEEAILSEEEEECESSSSDVDLEEVASLAQPLSYVQGEAGGEVAGQHLASKTREHLIRAKGRLSLTVSKGDVYIVDPRVLHRGTANRGCVAKQMLYMSLEEKREGKLKLLGSTDSLLDRYRGKFTLCDLSQR